MPSKKNLTEIFYRTCIKAIDGFGENLSIMLSLLKHEHSRGMTHIDVNKEIYASLISFSSIL